MTRTIDDIRSEWNAVFGESNVPEWVRDSLKIYVSDGMPTGDCLAAFLANDLQGAVARADVETARVVSAIAAYLYQHVPAVARGSYESVAAWIKAHQDRRARVRQAVESVQGEPKSSSDSESES